MKYKDENFPPKLPSSSVVGFKMDTGHYTKLPNGRTSIRKIWFSDVKRKYIDFFYSETFGKRLDLFLILYLSGLSSSIPLCGYNKKYSIKYFYILGLTSAVCLPFLCRKDLRTSIKIEYKYGYEI